MTTQLRYVLLAVAIHLRRIPCPRSPLLGNYPSIGEEIPTALTDTVAGGYGPKIAAKLSHFYQVSPFCEGTSHFATTLSARVSPWKTNWRKRVRVERTDDIRDAVRRF